MMQRIGLVFLVALLALPSGFASAQVSDDVVKIGVLTDLSGPAATATGLTSKHLQQLKALLDESLS